MLFIIDKITDMAAAFLGGVLVAAPFVLIVAIVLIALAAFVYLFSGIK